MNIEIVKTIKDDYRLWDGDKLLADCGKGPEGEARATALWNEIRNLQVAGGESRACLETLKAILTDPANQVEVSADGHYIYSFDPATMRRIASAIGIPRGEPVEMFNCYTREELSGLIKPD